MPRRGGTPVRRNGYDSYHGRSRVRTFLKVLIVLLLVVLAAVSYTHLTLPTNSLV